MQPLLVVGDVGEQPGQLPGEVDHVRCHEVSVAAFAAAGDPTRFPDAGEPWQPLKLYYHHGWSYAKIKATHDLMLEHGVHAWDIAATKAIIEEAGGTFTDWSGTPTTETPDVLATNGKLHAEALAILRGNH